MLLGFGLALLMTALVCIKKKKVPIFQKSYVIYTNAKMVLTYLDYRCLDDNKTLAIPK